MFEPTKYLSFQDVKYNLRENEIILLETFITQEYFENMEPADANPYIHQTNFYTVAPSNSGTQAVQVYDPVYRKDYVDRYLELESGVVKPAMKEKMQVDVANPGSGVPVFHINEINHVLDFCQEVSKRKITVKLRNLFFPKMNTFEILFSNESKECSFDIILTIVRSIAQLASKCPNGIRVFVGVLVVEWWWRWRGKREHRVQNRKYVINVVPQLEWTNLNSRVVNVTTLCAIIAVPST
jgi:hypothetical protein